MKATSLVVGLAFALASASAGMLEAQSAEGRANRSVRADQNWGAQRSTEARLLKGIKLSNEQKVQLKELRQQQKKEVQADAAARRGENGAVRTRDTAVMRLEVERRHSQHLAAVRSILTAEQRAQFDSNVATMRNPAVRSNGQGEGRGEGKIRGAEKAGGATEAAKARGEARSKGEAKAKGEARSKGEAKARGTTKAKGQARPNGKAG